MELTAIKTSHQSCSLKSQEQIEDSHLWRINLAVKLQNHFVTCSSYNKYYTRRYSSTLSK